MIRKFTLALILFCILISCGKKGDPEYKDPKNEAKIQVILIQKT
jgi:predicted small lipoprotein YifL